MFVLLKNKKFSTESSKSHDLHTGTSRLISFKPFTWYANFKLFKFSSKNKIWFQKYGQMGIQLSDWVENIVGKGEIACYEQFLLFPQCFQKLSVDDASKWVSLECRVNSISVEIAIPINTTTCLWILALPLLNATQWHIADSVDKDQTANNLQCLRRYFSLKKKRKESYEIAKLWKYYWPKSFI